MNHKILIVDDEEKNISLMTLLLENAGYTVLSASNGAKGLVTARLEHPDLILMDIQMPDMDGFSVAHEIFADARTHDISVVGISAYSSLELRQRALRMGMVGFFQRPVSHEFFIEQMRAFLPSSKEALA